MNNSITIDKGERTTEKGKVVIKWHFTLVEEGDYDCFGRSPRNQLPSFVSKATRRAYPIYGYY